MSKLAEIVKQIGRYELGVEQYPGFKEFLTHGGVNTAHFVDAINLGTKYLGTAAEVYILNTKYGQATSQEISTLEAVLVSGVFIGLIEIFKYRGNKDANNIKLTISQEEKKKKLMNSFR